MARFVVKAGLTADLTRTAPAKFDLDYIGTTVEVLDGAVQVKFLFSGYNILDVILPSKVHLCVFKPGTVVPADGAEVFALAGAAIGTNNFPGHDPLLGDEREAQTVNVHTNTTSLFAGRETTIAGAILVPVLEYAE